MAVLLLLISASLDLNLYFYFTLFEKRNKLVNQPVCFILSVFSFPIPSVLFMHLFVFTLRALDHTFLRYVQLSCLMFTLHTIT